MRRGFAAIAALVAAGLVLIAATPAHADPRTIDLGSGRKPISAAVSPDGSTLYVGDDNYRALLALATSTEQTMFTRNLGYDSPESMAVSPDSSTIYTLQPRISELVAYSNTGAYGWGVSVAGSKMALNPAGTEAYVTSSGLNRLSVISTTSKSVTQTITVPGGPVDAAVSPNGSIVYTANPGNNTVSLISAGTVLQSVPVGSDPEALAVAPNGDVYVANTGDGTVSVIEAGTSRVRTTVTVGTQPTAIAYNAANGDMYVVNRGDNTVSLLSTQTNTVTLTERVGSVPVAVAINPVTGAAYVANSGAGNITVLPLPKPPVFEEETPPGSATVGTAYSYTFTADGEPSPTFSVDGDLPAGLTLTPAGVLSGTPTSAGKSTFVVRASNGVGQDATTDPITMRVEPKPEAPAFTADNPPKSATIGTPYSFTFTATGSPSPTFSVSKGQLPDGLTLSSDGVLSGTPTSADTFTFTVAASNGVGTDAATDPITITVTQAPVAPAFTADTPPAATTVGATYSYTFAASGSPSPTFSVSKGQLPAGLSLTAGGVLAGTPTATGTSTFTVAASNGVGSDATTEVTITVSKQLVQPTFMAVSPPSAATVGKRYSYQFTAAGNPAPTFTVTSGRLPAGLTLTPQGLLSGTPTSTGTWTFTVTASNGIGTGASTGSITIVTAAAAPSTTSNGSDHEPTSTSSGAAAPVATPVTARATFTG
ncbi:YVTN family beta-propeller protein [Curtobacterium luteum]|uniref:YVTN family beta-propeller protein n=1 Tax=Curtobacterium luteum TaxID=33881 RepID=A0A8H9GBP3_9MICO|nr:YncE family protein [Curtobacterium luteum]MBM7803381.1 YVTN family beta-propeller protein [Curtobacterium luteum]NUU51592.1 YncE family protein [Curtobacterium luteum]GGL07535.1 hypothetical protein GCM10009769_27280 [Curtobacterium luteum]